ncbi:MAG: delta-class carbonic anhydrase [Aquisalinus sp.]|nr:delta-class carbonic anhydrase [Aquisalinus sp.]
MTLTKSLIMTSSIAVLLAACGGDKTTEEKITDAAKEAEAAVTEAVAEVEETIAEATEPALCEGFGPQTPRDISSAVGTNPVKFTMAPASTEMNLCNIHTHTNAEHKGPGFSVYVGDGVNGGYACNGASELTEAELTPPEGSSYGGVVPGDTIEVHWVHTSCDIQPGEGLGSCLSDTCENPLLRVEAQSFLVVNDPNALDFTDFGYAGPGEGLHQPKALPTGTGTPVVFRGSTTGPSYTQAKCSPLEVTWSVRPNCAKVDINSLNRWAEEGNVFNETESHGVRQLVTAPELLDQIN